MTATTSVADSEGAVSAPPTPPHNVPRTSASDWVRRTLSNFRPELAVLTVLALITRMVNVTWTNTVVFDETYFKTDAGDYMTGKFFFDPHPPLGKELLALWAWISGQDPASMADNHHPNPVVRYLPAFAGALIVPVVWTLARQFGGSRKVAFLAGLAVLCDGALIVESRYILIDSMLILFGIAAVSCFMAARNRTGWRYWAFIGGAGLLAGASASTKWTGLTSIGVIGLLWFVEVIRRRKEFAKLWPRHLISSVLLPVLALSVYVISFAIHFALLTHSSGGGDDGWMSPTFQKTLIGSPTYDPKAHDHNPIADIYWLGHDILDAKEGAYRYEAAVTGIGHPYGSKWNTWPTMNRDIYYAAESGNRNVYLLGNPVVWWGTVAGIGIILVSMMFWFQRFKPWLLSIGILAVAYLADWLPFAAVDRVMFLYHYFFAFIYSILFVTIGLGALFGWQDPPASADGSDSESAAKKSRAKQSKTRQAPEGVLSTGEVNLAFFGEIAYVAICVAIVVGFTYFMPLTYGQSLDANSWERFWLHSWH